MMARLNSFSLRVVGAVQERDDGYVLLKHGQTYKLRLRNDRDVACDVELLIDGIDQGTFRLDPHESLLLERPANKRKLFTFFKLDSEEGQEIKPNTDSDEYGVISATFKPAKKVFRPEHIYRATRSYGTSYPGFCRLSGSDLRSSGLDNNTHIRHATWSSCDVPIGSNMNSCNQFSFSEDVSISNASAGVTGLTGHSDQDFYSVPCLDYDMEQAVTIQLRLVCAGAVRDLEPLTPVINKLSAPPPIR